MMLIRLILLSFVFLQYSVKASASFNGFTERILLLETQKGKVLSESILAHEVDRSIYFLASDLFEFLGFKTGIFIDAKTFNADLVSPKINITMNWSDCRALKNEENIKAHCLHFKVYEDDLFISLDLAERLLDSSLHYMPYQSKVRIETVVKYPKINRVDRKEKTIAAFGRGVFDPGFTRIKPEPQTLKSIFLDQQFTFRRASGAKTDFQYYSNFSTDILQHEIQVTGRGNNNANDFVTWQIKRDYYGSEKNKYVSTYQLGNVVIPSAELIGGPASGRGAYITNRDQALINFGEREFEGNLRPDWEVELYLNDSLLGRRVANENGRYRFKNIPLQYGENLFRLEFYGPLGERKTEFVNNNVSTDNLKKGRFNYEAGVSEGNNSEHQLESLFQMSYGLTNSLSAYTGYTRYSFFGEDELRDYAVLGLNGYRKSLSYSVLGGFDFFNRGNFYALRSQFIFRKKRLQFLYLDADRFQSREIGGKDKFLDKRYKINFNTTLFGRASAFYRFEQDLFEDKTRETDVIQNVVLPMGRLIFLFENNLGKSSGNKADLIYTYFKNQFRSSFRYDWGESEALKVEYRNRFKRESSVFFSYESLFKDRNEIFRLGYQKRFSAFFLGLEASVDTQENYNISARLRSSFGYMKEQKKMQASPDLIAESGNICANVFEDVNRNGVVDLGLDKPVEGVRLRWAQGNVKFSTDKRGRAFLGNLPMYTPLDIHMLVKSLKDPQISPVESGFRVSLQKGQCKTLNFLVRRTYEYEGQVVFPEGSPIKRLSVHLLDANGKVLEEVRTDRDGYFLFDSVPSRVYYMRVKDPEYISTPEIYILNPYDDKSFEQTFYFDMSKI